MAKPTFKFFFQPSEESALHTKILREVEGWTMGDPYEARFTYRLFEMYFFHLLRTNLAAAAEMFDALDRIENEKKAARLAKEGQKPL